jgi:hypothetical protein
MSAPVFRTSRIDPRRLNQPAHQIAPMTHGERLRIHGPIRPMSSPVHPEPVEGHGPIAPMRAPPRPERIVRASAAQLVADRIVRWLAFAVAAFCTLYFAAELARGLL